MNLFLMRPEAVKRVLTIWVEQSSLRRIAKRRKVSTSTLHRFLQGKEMTLTNFLKLEKYIRK